MRRRPKQTHHGEGGAGVSVFAVREEAGEGDRRHGADAVPVRVRHDVRGHELQAAETELPGGGSVPVRVGDARFTVVS